MRASHVAVPVGSTVEVASSRHNFEGMRGNVLSYDVKQGLCRVSLTISGGQRRTHQLPPALLRVIPSAQLVADKAVLEKTYAPSGAGYKRALDDFEAHRQA